MLLSDGGYGGRRPILLVRSDGDAKGVQHLLVLRRHLVAEDQGLSCERVKQNIEPAVTRDHGGRHAELGERDRAARHARQSSDDERERADDVDDWISDDQAQS